MALNVAIFGSCVSRDAVGLVPEIFTPAHYTARQAWVSANSPAAWAPPVDRLSSPFQRRMLREDFHSSLLSQIKEEAPSADVVLLDIVDDRLGVIEYWPKRYATLSAELSASGWLTGDSILRRRRLHLGDPAHFERFKAAAAAVKAELVTAEAWEKTHLVKAIYASEAVEGGSVQGDYGASSEEWNARYAPYYEHLSELGFNMIEPKPELLFSTLNHKWGAHPIHYQEDASRDLMTQLAAKL